jgi:hypothetical protein
MNEEEFKPEVCKKCGAMIEKEEELVVMVWPAELEMLDTYFHDTCAYVIVKFCKAAREGKRVRGW